MDIFKIKYLHELYPSIDFEEEFVSLQNVCELLPDYESQATSKKWPHVFDSVRKNRLIQSVLIRRYEVKFIVSRNLDVSRLAVGYVTLTTTAGETFIIYDVEVNKTKIEGDMNYMILLTFARDDSDIINHLASDNAATYHAGTPNVNVINYTVDNPSMVFNNISTYLGSSPLISKCCFKIPIDSITTQIEINDKFYLHTDNATFNALLDTSSEYLSHASCFYKDASYVYFWCNYHAKSGDFIYVLNTVTLDFEPDYRPLPVGITIASQTFTFNIYTFISPVITNVLTPKDNLSAIKGQEENQEFNSKYKLELKVFLKDAEMYLAEFLNYATFNDITLTLEDGTTVYRPIQTKDIIKEVDRDDLVGLHEYDVTFLYNNKNVNINR